MDIKNIFDFESKIDLLIDSNVDEMIGSIDKQGEFMNSTLANQNFEKIENSLNQLYENVRTLEELIDYAKIYVNSEIDSVIVECRGLLNEIENMNDLTFNGSKNYTTINVPLLNNDVAQYTDRNGESLSTCEIYNNVISLSGNKKDEAIINKVTVDCVEQVYENNPDDLINGESYRTHYFLDEIPKNGVTETVTFNFKSLKAINSIKMKLSNCKVTGIIYIHENNTETYDADIFSGIIPNRAVKAIRLLINSSTYETTDITVQVTDENAYEEFNSTLAVIYNNIKECDDKREKEIYESQMHERLDNVYLKKE